MNSSVASDQEFRMHPERAEPFQGQELTVALDGANCPQLLFNLQLQQVTPEWLPAPQRQVRLLLIGDVEEQRGIVASLICVIKRSQ